SSRRYPRRLAWPARHRPRTSAVRARTLDSCSGFRSLARRTPAPAVALEYSEQTGFGTRWGQRRSPPEHTASTRQSAFATRRPHRSASARGRSLDGRLAVEYGLRPIVKRAPAVYGARIPDRPTGEEGSMRRRFAFPLVLGLTLLVISAARSGPEIGRAHV